MGGDLKAGGVENLRTDVRMQSDKAEARRAQRLGDSRKSLPAGKGEPEFLVFMRGRDELVRVRFDADGNPDENGRLNTEFGSERGKAAEFGERVDDDPPDTGLQRGPQFGVRLVVAVEDDPCRIDAGPQRHGQFVTGADVETELLVSHPPGDAEREQRLGGVVHRGALEGGPPTPAAGPEIRLVNDIARRAEFGSHRAQVDAADADFAVRAAARG